jgi:hypothetical protein
MFYFERGRPTKAKTAVVSKQPFLNYLNDGQSFGATVRQIYHEFVHIRLQLGKLDGFEAMIPTEGRFGNIAIHETIATYYQLNYKHLPPMRANEIKGLADLGSNYYYNSIIQEKSKKDLLYMKTYFEKIKK